MCRKIGIMQNTMRTQKKLAKMRKIYMIGCWAHWGAREYPFSGKYTKIHGFEEPMVWTYNDGNGMYDRYILVPITSTTMGMVHSWSFDPEDAQQLADKLEEEDNY